MPSLAPKRWEAFLSYNSQDRAAVTELAQRLKREELTLYLDEWEMEPGWEFQPALARALNASKSVVAFLGPSGLARWQMQEIQVAIDKATHDEAFHVIPVLLPGAERPRRGDVAHLEFLINASWVEFVGTLDDERAFRRLVWGIKGAKPELQIDARYADVCPYRGLEAFRPEDECFFFGRERLTGWLISALRREVQAKPQGARFLAVIGPSGSGKSSVVLAGLVPKLKNKAITGSERWPIAILRPGDEPLTNLAAAIVPSLQPPGANPDIHAVYRLMRALREDEASQALDIFARTALHDRPEEVRLLVVIDQFEELFTYRPEDGPPRKRFEDDRSAYLANLLNAAAAPGGRVAILLTMRSDFLGACTTYPQLSAVLSAHQELVGPMNQAELREAIVQPAFLVGHEVEPALVERLLADVKGQAGALPLLQFALTELWKKRDVRRLTLRAYEELGRDEHGKARGIEGTLEHRANEIYSKLDQADQELCRRIFLRLVQLGEGTEDTKRRVPIRELLPANVDRAAAVRKLIYTLSERDARLITTEGGDANDGWVEVAHEALITGWTRLHQWVDADRASLRTQQRLTEAAGEWAAAKPEEKDGHLYFGARLAVCREWVLSHPDELLGSLENEFLSASEEAERRQKQDALEKERRLREAAEAQKQEAEALRQEAEAQKLEAEAQKQVAEAQKQKAEALRQEAEAQKQKAEAQKQVADAQKQKAEAQKQEAEAQKQEAEAQKQVAEVRKQEAEAAAERAKRLSNGLLVTAIVAGVLAAACGILALWADNSRIAALAATKREKDAGRLADSRRVAALAASEMDKHLDRSLIMAVEACKIEHTIEARNSLFNALVARPRLSSFLSTGRYDVRRLALSAEGKILAAGYDADNPNPAGAVVLWDMATRTQLLDKPLPVPAGSVTAVAFSPDGKILAVGFREDNAYVREGKGVMLWDVERRTWSTVEPLAAGDSDVTCMAFSPDGTRLAAGCDVGVMLWDVARRTRLAEKPISADASHITSLAFSPDGSTMAAGLGYESGTGGVMLWSAAGLSPMIDKPLAIREGPVTRVAFSRDGKILAAGYSAGDLVGGGGVSLWVAATRTPCFDKPLTVGEGPVTDLAFSPDSKTLVTAYGVLPGAGMSGRGGTVLWDLERGSRIAADPLDMAGTEVTSVTFISDVKLVTGHGIISGGRATLKGGGALWDVTSRHRLVTEPLPIGGGHATSVAFSPDGTVLATGYGGPAQGGGVMLWSVASRTRIATDPMALTEGHVTRVAFSPDGKTLAGVFDAPARGGGVMLWDVENKARRRAGPMAIAEGRITSISFSPDSKTLATTFDGAQSGLMLWLVERQTRLTQKPLMGPAGRASSLAYSFDGTTLAAAYFGAAEAGAVSWNAASRTQLKDIKLPVTEGHVTSVALSPDGKTLAAGLSVYQTGGVALWDVAQPTPLALESLDVPEGPVNCVAFSRDGKTLAGGCDAGSGSRPISSVVLWDLAQRIRLIDKPLEITKSLVSGVTFSPDGNTVAARYTGEGGGVVLCDVDIESWQHLAGDIANRNLTRAESGHYFPNIKYRPTFAHLPVPPEADPSNANSPSPGH
jgi:WD40 repeat protein